LEDVFFRFDEAILDAAAKRLLDENVDLLISNPNVSVLIEGHADMRGSETYNRTLSKRRALAVKDYLVARGIDRTRLAITGIGGSLPFAEGRSESAWKLNRRVHFIVTNRFVEINGTYLRPEQIENLERDIGSQIPNGQYWLDVTTGIWGYAGDPTVRGRIPLSSYRGNSNYWSGGRAVGGVGGCDDPPCHDWIHYKNW
jgi:hypothetical protein